MDTIGSKLSNVPFIASIAEIFPAANWLEREVAELHGLKFVGQGDTRNLLLQYGDSTAPFQKSFSSIGLKEVIYDIITDSVIRRFTTAQF
jgi:NADH-quinone oxidoreductase subunit C